MRKTAAIAVAGLTGILLLSACSSSPQAPSPTGPNPSASSTQEASPEASAYPLSREEAKPLEGGQPVSAEEALAWIDSRNFPIGNTLTFDSFVSTSGQVAIPYVVTGEAPQDDPAKLNVTVTIGDETWAFENGKPVTEETPDDVLSAAFAAAYLITPSLPKQIVTFAKDVDVTFAKHVLPGGEVLQLTDNNYGGVLLFGSNADGTLVQFQSYSDAETGLADIEISTSVRTP